MNPFKIIFLILPFVVFRAEAGESDVVDVVEYGAGVFGSIYIHEVGHALTAKAFGATNIDINVPKKDGGWLSGEVTYVMPEPSAFKSQVISASGLFAASLAGEIVLQSDGLHENEFAQSIFATGQVSNLMHVYRYYTEVRGRNGWGSGNDIDHFELAGGNAHALNAVLVAYSLWSIKRASDEAIPIFGITLKF